MVGFLATCGSCRLLHVQAQLILTGSSRRASRRPTRPSLLCALPRPAAR